MLAFGAYWHMDNSLNIDLQTARDVALNLRVGTLALFVREGEILLGMKKRGFGAGKWNGIGGKVSSEETVEAAMAREVEEEIGVVPIEFDHVADLYFYDPSDESGNWNVHVYLVTDWIGDIVESEEIKPLWIAKANIPYSEMWDDDKFWLPKVLEGKKIEGHFLFSPDKKIVEHEISELEV